MHEQSFNEVALEKQPHDELPLPEAVGFNERSSEAIAQYKESHPELYTALLEAGPNTAHELLAEHARAVIADYEKNDQAAYIAYGRAADAHYHLKAQATKEDRQQAQDTYVQNTAVSEADFQHVFSKAARSVVDTDTTEKAA